MLRTSICHALRVFATISSMGRLLRLIVGCNRITRTAPSTRVDSVNEEASSSAVSGGSSTCEHGTVGLAVLQRSLVL